MNEQLICIDSPADFKIGHVVCVDGFKKYIEIPCQIKAAVFMLCTQGCLRCSIGLKEYTLTPPSVITLIPNTYVKLVEMSDDVVIWFVAFSSAFMSQVNFFQSTKGCLSIINHQPVVPVSSETARTWEKGYELLYQDTFYPAILKNKEMIKAVFTLYSQSMVELYHHNQWIEKKEFTSEVKIYQDFIDLALKYYTTEHNVSFYAEQLRLTPAYFATSIKKAVGNTPLEIIARMLLIDAKAQLKGTALDIKTIALSLGFHNLSYFNKFFRQHEGMTPQEYRGKVYIYSSFTENPTKESTPVREEPGEEIK